MEHMMLGRGRLLVLLMRGFYPMATGAPSPMTTLVGVQSIPMFIFVYNFAVRCT